MVSDAAFWDGIAEKYAAKPVENPDAFDRKIAITRERMQPGHVVLDIGCGTGSLALRLADAAAEVHGLDISSEMVRIAEGKAKDAGADNVRFHCGPFDDDFERSGVFAEGSLDGVCAYSILHLIPERSAALDRIFRLLKPGGFFVSSTVCLAESWVPYRGIIGVMRLFGRAPWVGMVSKPMLVDEVARAGFVGIEQPDVGAQSTVAFVVARKPL